jgi:hypothetical protein
MLWKRIWNSKSFVTCTKFRFLFTCFRYFMDFRFLKTILFVRICQMDSSFPSVIYLSVITCFCVNKHVMFPNPSNYSYNSEKMCVCVCVYVCWLLKVKCIGLKKGVIGVFEVVNILYNMPQIGISCTTYHSSEYPVQHNTDRNILYNIPQIGISCTTYHRSEYPVQHTTDRNFKCSKKIWVCKVARCGNSLAKN